MKKFLLFSFVFLTGAAVGSGGMFLAFPFLFPPAERNEHVGEDAELFLQSRFREDAPGQDQAHWGRGGIKLYRDRYGDVLLAFDLDFEVGPGPNYWLYLNSAALIEDKRDFKRDTRRLRLQKLKSFSGSQVYRVPVDIFSRAKAVTIWCESFDQFIASADLNGEHMLRESADINN